MTDGVPWDRAFIPDNTPDDRCGFTIEYAGLSVLPGSMTCWRETWDGHDRCIWHADDEDKPIDELAEARTNTRERLDGAVLRETNFRDTISFAGCWLPGSNLTGARFFDSDFTDTCLRDADLTDTHLRKADLTDADLWRADLTGADLKFATLTDTSLWRADLTNASLHHANLTDASLPRADLTDAHLYDADLNDAFLPKAKLTGVFLREVDLTGSFLPDADLTGADLRKADLTDAYLLGVDFSTADFYMAILADADLRKADLTEVNLRFVEFTGADLQNANLSIKDLRGVSFDGANLAQTDLSEADLRRATFEDARLHETLLDDARCNAETDLRAVHTYDVPELQPTDADDWFARRQLDFQIARHYLWPWRNPDCTSPEKAVTVHRKLQRILQENDLPSEVPHHFKREKHARRRQALKEGDFLTWLPLAGARWLTLYGESPWRVVYTALAVILAGTMLYQYTGLGDLSVFDRLYYSVMTFTPLMQAEGFPAPATWATKAVAMAQALLGVALTALLVAVLDRRITR